MAGKYAPLNLVFGDILTAARAATLETQYKLAKERTRPLGGIPNQGINSVAFVDIPGVIHVELLEDTAAKIHAMASVSNVAPASPTGSIQLYNVTDGAVVAGSLLTFTAVAAALQIGAELLLLGGKRYKLQVAISDATEYVLVYGAALVTQ